jgi:6-phosphofructokinase 2
MHPIATLTMSPALDLSTATECVEPTHKVRCGEPRYDPGGGGINVARVVKRLGGEVTAVYPAGGPYGEMIHRSLDAIGLTQRVVPIAGQTRESFTVDELSTGRQYRFVLPGAALSAGEIKACLDAIADLRPLPTYLVVSGGFPPGTPALELSADLAKLAREIGARLILDTSRAMRYAPESGVYLMKPSERELSAMVGLPTDTRAEQIAAAQSLVRQGRSEVVVVSIGAEGALLVTDRQVEHFQAPDVPPSSAVGAGDSMVGAMVFALERGWSLQEAVRYGVAAGTATLMTPGTELCHVDDVEKLYRSTIEEPA